MPVILDGSRRKPKRVTAAEEVGKLSVGPFGQSGLVPPTTDAMAALGPASAASESHSVRSARSGILAQLNHLQYVPGTQPEGLPGIPALSQLHNEVFYPKLLNPVTDQTQPFSIAESHRSLNSQKIPTSSNRRQAHQDSEARSKAREAGQRTRTTNLPEGKGQHTTAEDDRQRGQRMTSGMSSSIGQHIEVQGVELNDSSHERPETEHVERLDKFHDLENLEQMNLQHPHEIEGVRSVKEVQHQAILDQALLSDASLRNLNDLTDSAKIQDTSNEDEEDVSKISPHISQINIDKTIESRSRSVTQAEAQLEEQKRRQMAHDGGQSSNPSGSFNAFKQY